MRRGLIIAGVALSVTLLAAGRVYRDELARLYDVVFLFDRAHIVANFRSMDRLFRTRTVHGAAEPHTFARRARPLPEYYRYRGRDKSLAAFLDETWTTGLIVIRDGRIVFEAYYRGNTARTRTMSWSLAKSFVSALVGIAVAEGDIASIRQPVTDYLPELAGTGYDGVSIKDVLQMSSGVRFDEDYADFFSDINRMGRAAAFDQPLDEMVASLPRERPPGTYHHYVSMNTQVLGMLVRAATGETLAHHLETRIWRRIGAESDAYWLLDSQGVEMAFGGFNAVLRDYARFGLLYLNSGRWAGEQVVPADWVRASVTPDAPHLRPGDNPASNSVLGYGYQWWIPDRPARDYLAIGIYNQFIYVAPEQRVVIVKSSAYPDYNVDGVEKELESIAVFRAIATNATE